MPFVENLNSLALCGGSPDIVKAARMREENVRRLEQWITGFAMLVGLSKGLLKEFDAAKTRVDALNKLVSELEAMKRGAKENADDVNDEYRAKKGFVW